MDQAPRSNRAAKLADQVTAVATSALGTDLRVRVAVRVNLRGLVAATAAGALGGGPGALAGARALESAAEQVSVAGFPADAQQALGLADAAIVVTSRSSLSGKPKEFRGLLPLGVIASVTFEPGRLGDVLRFTMMSGARADFQCVKVDPGEQFAAAVCALLPPEDATRPEL